jgi:hypothetical protein
MAKMIAQATTRWEAMSNNRKRVVFALALVLLGIVHNR